MTITITADSLTAAIPAICQALKHAPTDTQVWIPNEFTGYWARIKTIPETCEKDFIRNYRMHRNPQPYNVALIPWDKFMYRGISRGIRSSAL